MMVDIGDTYTVSNIYFIAQLSAASDSSGSSEVKISTLGRRCHHRKMAV